MAYPPFFKAGKGDILSWQSFCNGGHNHHHRSPIFGELCALFSMSSCVLGTPGKFSGKTEGSN